MDLKNVILDSTRLCRIPTVITDEVFTVSFFNGAAEKLIPGLTAGHKLDEYVKIYDKNELKRSKYPSSALIGYGGKKYFCAFCPVISGFFKECVFSFAAPDGEEFDDCEQYLTMKLAVLSKCFGEPADRVPAGKERAYGKLYSYYEAGMRLLTVMGGNETPAAVNVRELLEDAFSYYEAVKYREAAKKRYELDTNAEYLRIHKAVCVILVCAYDICLALSRNGFCSVSVNSKRADGTVSYSFSVKPKHKLEALLCDSDDAEDAVYSLLGRGAENIFVIKMLARQINGQADIEFDVLSDELRFSLTSPLDGRDYVKAGGKQLADIAHIAAQMCFRQRESII